jgi:hypothetical protein
MITFGQLVGRTPRPVRDGGIRGRILIIIVRVLSSGGG